MQELLKPLNYPKVKNNNQGLELLSCLSLNPSYIITRTRIIWSERQTSHLKYQRTQVRKPLNSETTHYQGFPREILPHLQHYYLNKHSIQTRDIYQDIGSGTMIITKTVLVGGR